MLRIKINISGGRPSFEERFISLSLGNTELAVFLGYHSRDADISRNTILEFKRVGSRRCGLGGHWHVCDLRYGRTRDIREEI